MAVHPLAGKPVPDSLVDDISALTAAYFNVRPDPQNQAQLVSFGTSGHRGCSRNGTFNEDHVLAVTQAMCEYRMARGITGPLFIGMDTHALSEPAHVTAIEVMAANGVQVRFAASNLVTPTPAVSHAILTWNRGRTTDLADGVVITPSHNQPSNGGFKYNPPHGGPAGGEETGAIQKRANQILLDGLRDVLRVSYQAALQAECVRPHDFITAYVADLKNIIRMDTIRGAGLKLGVDPLGGASLPYWERISDVYQLNLDIVNPVIDPTFKFMRLDHDGKIRMDCSSPYAMAGLIEYRDKFDVAFGNDPDSDRHGIVTRSAGLMAPNAYLAVAIEYLFGNRPGWPVTAAIGKTLVSSSIIDRVGAEIGRRVVEVPVGFKWFVDGLIDSSFGFGGEESAGASFLRLDGTVWTTDKDGIIADLLAAEILAVTGRDPGDLYADMERRFGRSYYTRIDSPADAPARKILGNLTPDMVAAQELAGEPIVARLTRAPGNDAPIGGLKVVTPNGWFAARPSGTEDIYKIYAESLKSQSHLDAILSDAREIVDAALGR